jgi:hypothetical protein
MAIIKIKSIKNNLQKVINYGMNGDKTEHGILVSSVNCGVSTVYEEMTLTKKFFHKEDKTLGYHIIQSFNGFEVQPERANEIGKQLAEEMWGDKYQVVICTHINKGNVHNHIILNSVSFEDGKKYHNGNADIAFLKDASDRLCLKYGLDVVNTPRAEKEKEIRQKSIDNFNRKDEKMKRIIIDIDDAIKSVKKYSDFKAVLKAKGYNYISDTGKYLTMKTPYFQRNVRVDRVFGEEYSVQGIKERIYYPKENNCLAPFANYQKKYYKKVYTGPKIDWKKFNYNIFYRWYVQALFWLGILPAKVTIQEVTIQDYKVRNKTKMVFEELSYINQSHSKSIEDIKNNKKEIEDKLPILKGERENLWVKHKKTNSAEEKAFILERINLISDKISTLYGQRNACIRLIDTYNRGYEKVQKEFEIKEKSKELNADIQNKKLRTNIIKG